MTRLARHAAQRSPRPAQLADPPPLAPLAAVPVPATAVPATAVPATAVPATAVPATAVPVADAKAARTFQEEINDALWYEKGLAVKALIALALVVLVVTIRVLFLG